MEIISKEEVNNVQKKKKKKKKKKKIYVHFCIRIYYYVIYFKGKESDLIAKKI
jgi:hypothetical protein